MHAEQRKTWTMLRVRCLRGGSRGAEAVHYIGSRVSAYSASGPVRGAGWGPRGRLDIPVRVWSDLGSVAREGVFWEDACEGMDGAYRQVPPETRIPRALQGSWNASVLSPTCCSSRPSASLGYPSPCLQTLPCSLTGIDLADEFCQQLVLEQLSLDLLLWVSTLGSLQLPSRGIFNSLIEFGGGVRFAPRGVGEGIFLLWVIQACLKRREK